MRNHILPIAIAFVLAAPCNAFAGEKKTIEVNSFSFGATNSGSSTSSGAGSGRIGPDKVQHKHIGGVKYEDVSQGATGPTKPPTNQITPGWNTCTDTSCPTPLTTNNPALKGNALSPSPKAGYDLKANRKM